MPGWELRFSGVADIDLKVNVFARGGRPVPEQSSVLARAVVKAATCNNVSMRAR